MDNRTRGRDRGIHVSLYVSVKESTLRTGLTFRLAGSLQVKVSLVLRSADCYILCLEMCPVSFGTRPARLTVLSFLKMMW